MFKVELKQHPAQAIHPITRAKLFRDDGTPVPLFPNQRSIYVDGYFVGYVCEPPARRVAFINSRCNIPELIAEVQAAVEAEFGVTPTVTHVPEPIEAGEDHDFEED